MVNVHTFKKTHHLGRILALTMTTLLLASVPFTEAVAQTATNLKCKNCVDGKEVKNSSLTGSDIKNSSLTGSDIKNSSLTGSDVKNESLTGADIEDGSIGTSDLSDELQGDIIALGIDINILQNQQKAKVGFDVPDHNLDKSNGHSFGTIYIQLGANDVFISRADSIGAAIWEQLTPKKYAVGDVGPAGGWVFYITDGGLHGLEAAPEDLGNLVWGCTSAGFDDPLGRSARGEVIGTGGQNTGDILARCMEPDIAARVAANYWLNGYNDWYLPSFDELLEMIQQLTPNADFGFVDDDYWSSMNNCCTDTSSITLKISLGSSKRARTRTISLPTRAIRTF